jgi:hypothetical protein
MRSRDKSGRLFYPILQTAGFAGFFCRRSQAQRTRKRGSADAITRCF